MAPRIGLLGLTLELYKRTSPELVDQLGEFSAYLRDKLAALGDIDHVAAAYTRAEIEKAVARFDRDDVDIIIVVLLSYSPSLSALPALLRTGKPLLIWNTQRLHTVGPDFGPQDISLNHGMHGVQDLCNVLRRHGRPFSLVTAHCDDQAGFAQVAEHVRAGAAVKRLRGRRIGILGNTFDGMGDLYVDHSVLLAQTGVEVRHVSSARLAELIAAAPEEAVNQTLASDREAFDIEEDVTEEDHRRSVTVELGVRALVEEEGLSALCALFYSGTDHPGIPTLPFLAISKLLAEGYGYGGEGDPTSATTVMLMQGLTEDTNFVEMFTVDFGGDALFMNHMAETNYALHRPDRRPRLIRNDAAFLPGEPSVCVFAVQRPGEVTLLNLAASTAGRLRMIGALAEVEDWGPVPGVHTPHFKLKPRYAGGVAEFLTEYSRAGGSHHLALGYGNHLAALRLCAEWMGIEWVEISDQ